MAAPNAAEGAAAANGSTKDDMASGVGPYGGGGTDGCSGDDMCTGRPASWLKVSLILANWLTASFYRIGLTSNGKQVLAHGQPTRYIGISA